MLRDFLDCSQGQLTAHGLLSLQQVCSCALGSRKVGTRISTACAQGLNDRQLAVFFRNNHFNVLFRRGDSLYILVTDQVRRFLCQLSSAAARSCSMTDSSAVLAAGVPVREGVKLRCVPSVLASTAAAASLWSVSDRVPCEHGCLPISC